MLLVVAGLIGSSLVVVSVVVGCACSPVVPASAVALWLAFSPSAFYTRWLAAKPA